MNLNLEAQPLPLYARDGALLVRKTRVPLDTIVFAFDNGATPETIVDQYSTLQLPDVYAVISYVLRNRQAVDEYLEKREKERQQLRKENLARLKAKSPATILKLQGIGKDAWKDIDIDSYLDEERNSWDG